MKQIEHVLRDKIGLDAKSIGTDVIQRNVRLRMKSHGLTDQAEYLALLRASEAEWEELTESVIVTETWFFRDNEPFAALARLVSEEFQRMNPLGKARLLSLPCASGEEPYSLVMALLDAGVAPERFETHAVDLSPRALAQAKRGVYRKNSFRGSDLGFRGRHFRRTREGFAIASSVCACVLFQQGNLLSEDFRPPGGQYDFIFCRNLLIYFDVPTQRRALERICSLLAPQGVLFVGAAEQALVLENGFVSAHIPMAFACRKAFATGQPASPSSRAEAAPADHGDKAPARSADPQTDSVATARDELAAAQRLADAGRLEEAASICEGHVKGGRVSAQAYYLLGLVRDAAGDSRAEEYYRKALYLDPKHRDALLQLALWLEKNGQMARARVLKRRAREAEQIS